MDVEMEAGPECWLIKRPSGKARLSNAFEVVDGMIQNYRLGFEAGFAEANGFEPNEVLTREA
jgi:hypothetical protein